MRAEASATAPLYDVLAGTATAGQLPYPKVMAADFSLMPAGRKPAFANPLSLGHMS